MGPRAPGQRNPIKAVAKCSRRCHLTVTPAPPPPRASLCLPRTSAGPAPRTRPSSDRPLGTGAGSGAGVPLAESPPNFPPSYHSRTRFLNLVPNVPASKFGPLGGGPRLLTRQGLGACGGLRAEPCELRVFIGGV